MYAKATRPQLPNHFKRFGLGLSPGQRARSGGGMTVKEEEQEGGAAGTEGAETVRHKP